MRTTILTLVTLTSLVGLLAYGQQGKALEAVTAEELGLDFGAFPDIVDPSWDLLDGVTIVEQERGLDWVFEKTFPEALVAAAPSFEISGYVIPMTLDDPLRHVMLVRNPIDCPYCGAGAGYAPALEVELAEGIPAVPEFARLRLRGTLRLIEDEMSWQPFRLEAAEVIAEN